VTARVQGRVYWFAYNTETTGPSRAADHQAMGAATEQVNREAAWSIGNQDGPRGFLCEKRWG